MLEAHFPTAGQRPFSSFDFSRADSIANVHRGASLEKLYELTYQLTSRFSSDEEKFRAIYTWICKNIRNDYATTMKNERQRASMGSNSDELSAWNEKLKPEVYQRLIQRKLTVCTGYGLLLREMALLAGIECRIVDGYGRTSQANAGPPGFPNHTWNAVRLNGKWYLCDPTWSSGTVNSEKQMFFANYDDGYFLAHPAQFVQDHYPLDTAWILLTEKPTLEEFLTRPLVYRAAYRHGVTDLSPARLKLTLKRSEQIQIAFTAAPGIASSRFKLLIKVGNSEQWPEAIAKEERPGRYVIRHKFDFATTYDLHVLMDDEPVVSYEVAVSRK